MPKISIVIPIYNVEAYLRRCIDSVVCQDTGNIELLLVDDGSEDGSRVICDSYAKGYSFIRTFHLKNGGVGKARNFGIEKASGDYLAFLDSDDYWDYGLLKIFEMECDGKDYDLIIFGFKDAPNRKNGVHNLKRLCYNDTDSLINLRIDTELNWSFFPVFNKFYKTSLIKERNIRFREDTHVFEDLIFNLDYYKWVKNAYSMGGIWYNYVQHGGLRLGGAYISPYERCHNASDILRIKMDLPNNNRSCLANILLHYRYITFAVDTAVTFRQCGLKDVVWTVRFFIDEVHKYGFHKELLFYLSKQRVIYRYLFPFYIVPMAYMYHFVRKIIKN